MGQSMGEKTERKRRKASGRKSMRATWIAVAAAILVAGVFGFFLWLIN